MYAVLNLRYACHTRHDLHPAFAGVPTQHQAPSGNQQPTGPTRVGGLVAEAGSQACSGWVGSAVILTSGPCCLSNNAMEV